MTAFWKGRSPGFAPRSPIEWWILSALTSYVFQQKMLGGMEHGHQMEAMVTFFLHLRVFFRFWKFREMDSFLLSWTLAWITRTISKVPLVTTSSRKQLQRLQGCGCVGRQWDKTWPRIWLKADQKEQVPKFPWHLNGYQCYQWAPKAVLFDMNQTAPAYVCLPLLVEIRSLC